MSKLPGMAFATLAVTGVVIAITLGESRYERVNTTKTADELNQMYGVTPAQARAMLAGVLVGWRTRLANPELYGPYGELLDEPVAA
jgi:ribosomal protein L5